MTDPILRKGSRHKEKEMQVYPCTYCGGLGNIEANNYHTPLIECVECGGSGEIWKLT